MKITIRGSVFETNSSSEHSFIHMSKNTFEAWKRGKKRLKMRGDFRDMYDERDFTDTIWRIPFGNWRRGTYRGIVRFHEGSGGDMICKCEAKKEHVDPEEWEDATDDDPVYQHPYMEIIDNGRTVTIHMWGR